jgi:hypothetical protein
MEEYEKLFPKETLLSFVPALNGHAVAQWFEALHYK